jgi:hypothetical protein
MLDAFKRTVAADDRYPSPFAVDWNVINVEALLV